ncbi:hypothetical protein WISP_18179 [Willisornis vidua]|uniref:Secreted protein n=1 Tax=Willisornis vidua TaxID=1566151 RepID=A0ABQ9DP63_9PASS|nr:hypothetical protein WISP_18179 [Willisornis vidua]
MLCLMPPRTPLALLAARALLTHIPLAIDQDPQIPFYGTACQRLIPQSLECNECDSYYLLNQDSSSLGLHVY